MPKAPKPGWTTTGQCVRVVDGDTVVVQIVKQIRVRLLDCWCPETKLDHRVSETDRESEKRRGRGAREFTRSLVEGRQVVVTIPPDADGDIGDVFTLDRALGHVWLEENQDKSVSEQVVAAGHAVKSKPVREN